jgi:hypothetical protein
MTKKTDVTDLAAIREDIVEGLAFIRNAQGYGEVVVRIQLRKGTITGWEVGPSFTRRPRVPDDVAPDLSPSAN